MNDLIIWIVITGLLLTAFSISLYFSVKRKSKPSISISVILFILLVSASIYTALSIGRKSYRFAKQHIHNPFSDRKGIDIYVALFGKPIVNCVLVTNKMDQKVPRLDCCIWLEFATCPRELKRILLLGDYKNVEIQNNKVYVPDYSPKPEWFNPLLLGDSISQLEILNADNHNRHQIIFFNRDSSRVFYCDMAD